VQKTEGLRDVMNGEALIPRMERADDSGMEKAFERRNNHVAVLKSEARSGKEPRSRRKGAIGQRAANKQRAAKRRHRLAQRVSAG
jgi:hypothetical protein